MRARSCPDSRIIQFARPRTALGEVCPYGEESREESQRHWKGNLLNGFAEPVNAATLPTMRYSESFRRATVCLLMVVVVVSISNGASDDLRFTHAITRAQTLLAKELQPKVPGYCVAVAVEGNRVWEACAGYADLGIKSPVTPDTLFRVGSISKSITSVGLMLLVEQGRMDLDVPIQTYLPDFPEKNAPISLRLLAGHLSGIRNYRGDEALSSIRHENYRSRLEIFAHDPLVAAPGMRFRYSGYNWTLIEAAMAQVAGVDFPTFIRTRVLKPLGLEHTFAENAELAEVRGTKFYEVGKDGQFVLGRPIDVSFAWAVGGYLATARDLVSFGCALQHPGLLSERSLQWLFHSQKTTDGESTGYGIGWYVYEQPRVIYHTGWTVGGLSVLLILPDKHVVIAIVTNRGALNVGESHPLHIDLESIGFQVAKAFADTST